jgi:hypothetical protein
VKRRKFLIGAVAGGIGLVEYGFVSRFMSGLHGPHRLSVKAYEHYGEKAALVALTPNDDFYVTSKGPTPRIDLDRWQLKFDGLVTRPFSLTYQELLALPGVEKVLTLECISNSIGGTAIGNARWTGTPLKPLIERARPLPEAAHAILYAADGFSTGHPTARLWNEENFLAYRMNGQDLPPDHGYPVRIFIPGKYGMKQPKWITRVQLVNKAYLGYWESQGWSDLCERWAHARFTDLESGAKISRKNFELTGYALSNLDGIKSVEISFDGGRTWQATNLFSSPSPLVWSFWKQIWINPKPGVYEIRVRAIDNKGRAEDTDPKGIYPDGATGQQVLNVTVV